MSMRNQTSSIQTKNRNAKTTAFWDLMSHNLLSTKLHGVAAQTTVTLT